jgi:hypothetical protein
MKSRAAQSSASSSSCSRRPRRSRSRTGLRHRLLLGRHLTARRARLMGPTGTRRSSRAPSPAEPTTRPGSSSSPADRGRNSRLWISGCRRSTPPRADHGREDEARAALNEAASLYDGLQARWTSCGPRAGSAPTASGAAPAAPAGSVRPPAGRRSRRPRSRSPPWSAGRLNVGHRQGFVRVTTCRPDLHLPHPRQARREGPGGDRPGGAAPGASRPSRAHQPPPLRQSVVT